MNVNEQLLQAIYKNEIEAVKTALDAGADANSKDKNGIPALHHAMPYSDIIKMLLEHGANPDIRDNDGNCALHNDCSYIEHNDCDIASACLLLECGVNVDTRNDFESTPLIDNCWSTNNSLGFIRFLIESGADVNAQDDEGRTPLHNAIWDARVDVVELLLEHGAAASADISGDYGTPLEFAERSVEEYPDDEDSFEILKKIKKAVKAL